MKLINVKSIYKIKEEETGAIVIVVAISLVVVMSSLALVIDIGLANLKAGEIQKASDVAAYSAGKLLPVDQDDLEKINEIKDKAIYYANLNGYTSLQRSDVTLGNLYHGEFTSIKVITSKNVQMNFAKVIGVNSINITRHAMAKLSPKSKITGATPLGLPKDEFDDIISDNNQTHIVLKYGKHNSERGFFGALDLDGDKGGGASDYRRWLAQGYPGETTIGDELYKENGNMVGPTYQGFSERYNGCTHFGAQTGGPGCTIDHYDPDCPRVAKVVIYQDYDNSRVIVAGFAAFILENQTSMGEIQGSYVSTISFGGENTGKDAGTPEDSGLYSLVLSE